MRGTRLYALWDSPPAHTSSDTPVVQHRAPDAVAKAPKKATHVANRKLERAVRSALVKRGRRRCLAYLNLREGGKVTLSGSVPDKRQIQLTEKHTSQADGVTNFVGNRLNVCSRTLDQYSVICSGRSVMGACCMSFHIFSLRCLAEATYHWRDEQFALRATAGIDAYVRSCTRHCNWPSIHGAHGRRISIHSRSTMTTQGA